MFTLLYWQNSQSGKIKMNSYPFNSYSLEQYQIGETQYQEQTDAVTDNYIYRLTNKHGKYLNLQGAGCTVWQVVVNGKRSNPNVSTVIEAATGLKVNAITFTPPRVSRPKLKQDGLHGIYALHYRGEQLANDSTMLDDCLYIGESKDVHTRFKQHLYDARTGKKVSDASYPLDRVWKRILKRGGLDSIEQFLLVELPPVPTWNSFQNRKLREAVETFYIHKWSVHNGKVDELTEEQDCDIYYYDLNVKLWQVSQDDSHHVTNSLTAYMTISKDLPERTVSTLQECLNWWSEQGKLTGNW